MTDPAKVKAAKKLLRDAGYICIPRENVRRYSASHSVDALHFHRYNTEPGFMEKVREQVGIAIGTGISRIPPMVEWRTEKIDYDIEIIGTVAFLSAADGVDPFLQMIREEQR
jgi:hypothetical protein